MTKISPLLLVIKNMINSISVKNARWAYLIYTLEVILALYTYYIMKDKMSEIQNIHYLLYSDFSKTIQFHWLGYGVFQSWCFQCLCNPNVLNKLWTKKVKALNFNENIFFISFSIANKFEIHVIWEVSSTFQKKYLAVHNLSLNNEIFML